jgi:hypothetical protein
LKIPNTKWAGGVAKGVGPEFKPQYHKKQKQKNTFFSFLLAYIHCMGGFVVPILNNLTLYIGLVRLPPTPQTLPCPT